MNTGTNKTCLLLLCAAAVALASCSQKTAGYNPSAASDTDPSEAPVDYGAIAASAVSDPSRPEADKADDARRKPATALEFMQIAPSVSVFEIEAGGGWYTELLSHGVGPSGKVTMQNPEGFLAFVGEQIAARLANDRLSNVRRSISNFDNLEAADGSIDLATWVQGPHELYFKPSDGPALGDPSGAFDEIFRIVKPGGALVVIDHAAIAGAPETTGNDLHRIDKAVIIKLAQDAGFALEKESDFLANADDPLTSAVFDPAIRGYTSQFALRFRKPA